MMLVDKLNKKIQLIEKSVLKRPLLIISLTYVMAYFFILLNDGLFWDDWVDFNQTLSTKLLLFKEMGFFCYWPAYLFHVLLNSHIGVVLSRLLLFVSFFLSSILLYNILKKIKEIDPYSRLFLVLFFSLFPVDFARIYGFSSVYALSYLLFFLGSWLLCVYLEGNAFVYRVLSLLCFFISFSVNSFLVLYSIVFIYILYSGLQKGRVGLWSNLKYLIRFYDLILLPILFWILKSRYFSPSGLYGGYNSINIKSLVPFSDILTAFQFSFLWTISSPLAFIITALCLVLFDYWIRKIRCNRGLVSKNKVTTDRDSTKDVSIKWLLLFGILVFIAAVYPYIVVGKIPSHRALSTSRFELLIPLGAAFILYYLVKLITVELRTSKSLVFVLYSSFVVLFIMTNMSWYYKCQKDWFKQLALVENFRSSEIMRNSTTFFFIDETTDLDANRGYDDEDLVGLLKYAFGNTSKLGSNSRSDFLFSGYKKVDFFNTYKQYNVQDWKPKDNYDYNVVIKYGKLPLDKRLVLKLYYLRIFDHQEFRRCLKDILTLEFQKIATTKCLTDCKKG